MGHLYFRSPWATKGRVGTAALYNNLCVNIVESVGRIDVVCTGDVSAGGGKVRHVVVGTD